MAPKLWPRVLALATIAFHKIPHTDLADIEDYLCEDEVGKPDAVYQTLIDNMESFKLELISTKTWPASSPWW